MSGFDIIRPDTCREPYINLWMDIGCQNIIMLGNMLAAQVGCYKNILNKWHGFHEISDKQGVVTESIYILQGHTHQTQNLYRSATVLQG